MLGGSRHTAHESTGSVPADGPSNSNKISGRAGFETLGVERNEISPWQTSVVRIPERPGSITIPKLLLEHARVRADQPAIREKGFGIWQKLELEPG